ncbi:DgyrCDS8819 [Dimorphilus gyrociliatus]|uniref:DgyrCDS8819 n=1 Tax=Dimorphilus gyrociliatus TaxID=2664684 RepID=A0A7I8VXI0_9ANNE|nr:DgyrCDS8819 [Dimorphilus gyrociliatus]
MPSSIIEESEEKPLPPGWERQADIDGKIFFIDHNTRTTSWVDPRDRDSKPKDISDCKEGELPYGWEKAYDQNIGIYYINHLKGHNQIEDPRELWKKEQKEMLSQYLDKAQSDLETTREMLNVKEERLRIAQNEGDNLRNFLANFKASKTSLASSASTRYDPDIVRDEIELSKKRVTRLALELNQIRMELSKREKGVQALYEVQHKMDLQETPYTLSEATTIYEKIKANYHMIDARQKKKHSLLLDLARLKEDVERTRKSTSPDVSTFSINRLVDSESQTDLSGDNDQMQREEFIRQLVRLRLRYSETRRTVANLQKQLVDVESRINPGQCRSDKDLLLLIQEKEQLLRELKPLVRKGGKDEISNRQKMARLQNDLREATQMNQKQINERLQLDENKQRLMEQLQEVTRLSAQLEQQIKSLSQSTLSMSSGSSRGSLGSLAGSHFSLSDVFSYTPLSNTSYGQDLHGKVEGIFRGAEESAYANLPPLRSQDCIGAVGGYSEVVSGAFSCPGLAQIQPVEPYDLGPPPTYAQHMGKLQRGSSAPSLACRVQEMHLSAKKAETATEVPPLSPISESSSGVGASGPTRSYTGSSPSDGGVTSDSGVFESFSQNSDNLAQLQLTLTYLKEENCLQVNFDQVRYLRNFQCSLCLVARLIPETNTFTSCPFSSSCSKLGDIWKTSLGKNSLQTTSLQVHLCSIRGDNLESVGVTEVTLNTYDRPTTCWYNILSEVLPVAQPLEGADKVKELLDTSDHRLRIESPRNSKARELTRGSSVCEESSDESTIIASQPSTLSRNLDPSSVQNLVDTRESSPLEIEEETYAIEEELSPCDTVRLVKRDAETNTEAAVCNPPSKLMVTASEDAKLIRRSKTFSPAHSDLNFDDHNIYRLNRSDSDSTLPKYQRKSPFQRYASERRSIRLSKAPIVNVKKAKSTTQAPTSLDLELALQASKQRVEQEEEDILRLTLVKEELEKIKRGKEGELPEWMRDDGCQSILNRAEKLNEREKSCTKDSKVEDLAEKKLKKATHEINKLRRAQKEPNAALFKERMAFFTSPASAVPVSPQLAIREQSEDLDSNV